MAITRLSRSSGDNLEKEAGRELAAFLRAVEETQGTKTVEIAGTIWIDILRNRPQTDFCAKSSFRSITMEAAGSLVSLLGLASPMTTCGPEYESASIDQAKPRRIHLVTKAERVMSAQYSPDPALLLNGDRRGTGGGGLKLVS